MGIILARIGGFVKRSPETVGVWLRLHFLFIEKSSLAESLGVRSVTVEELRKSNSLLFSTVSHMGDIFIVVRSKRQIVIPAFLLKKLRIKTGTRVAIRCEENQLILQPINTAFIRSLRGSCKGRNSIAVARDREHKRDDRLRSRKLLGKS
jgi:bifunctional DNA-binding transcriptional regulator/antitoxin component of YhaV-PrlF toxin-antitoxin module